MSATLTEQFERIQLEERMMALRQTNALLNQAIACAYCPECGEVIADQQWAINDDDHLVHEGCRQ